VAFEDFKLPVRVCPQILPSIRKQDRPRSAESNQAILIEGEQVGVVPNFLNSLQNQCGNAGVLMSLHPILPVCRWVLLGPVPPQAGLVRDGQGLFAQSIAAAEQRRLAVAGMATAAMRLLSMVWDRSASKNRRCDDIPRPKPQSRLRHQVQARRSGLPKRRLDAVGEFLGVRVDISAVETGHRANPFSTIKSTFQASFCPPRPFSVALSFSTPAQNL